MQIQLKGINANEEGSQNENEAQEANGMDAPRRTPERPEEDWKAIVQCTREEREYAKDFIKAPGTETEKEAPTPIQGTTFQSGDTIGEDSSFVTL